MSLVERSAPVLTGRQAWTLVWVLAAALVAWLFIAVWPTWLDAVLISKKAFINSLFNGITLARLYFLVASGFTLVFGLMPILRTVRFICLAPFSATKSPKPPGC